MAILSDLIKYRESAYFRSQVFSTIKQIKPFSMIVNPVFSKASKGLKS